MVLVWLNTGFSISLTVQPNEVSRLLGPSFMAGNEGTSLTCQGRLRSFSLSLTARTPVNGAQSSRFRKLLEPAINDGPDKKTVLVLHSAEKIPR